jgi:3,4-dihydroxy 2-butanone 4-phosphate synthase/GTP cyclohydrolase II
MTSGRFASIDAAVSVIRRGGMALVIDSEDRENEGDVVMAAQHVTPSAINFMMTHARGLICAPVLPELLAALRIPPMVVNNNDPRGTAFHVSVDLRRPNRTGISARDRAETIAALADPRAHAADFTQPGHVFPLAYREGGVRVRAGHTEASIDLVRLAGLTPAAAICEVADDNGDMARLPALVRRAQAWHMPLITIEALKQFLDDRRDAQPSVVSGARTAGRIS